MRGTKRSAAPNTAAVSVATISDVPNPIVCDILSRLPLNSIFTCKQVSKAWRDLILDPHFERLHLSRSPLSLFFFRNGDINNIYKSNSASSHFEIFQLHDPPILEHYRATMKFKTEVYFSGMHIAASCNGLILLSNCSLFGDDRVIVCNPLRAQHFILPKPPKIDKNLPTSGFGFGHSPVTDQYKVLRFYRTFCPSILGFDIFTSTSRPSILGFDIYTIGIDDKWRSIGYPEQPPPVYTSQLVFLNGAFHWIGFENENSWFICYFDIEKEKFGSFPLPSHIGISFPYLGVVDNWLYIQEDCPLYVQKLWVMKDYGDFWSWTLECVIEGARLGTAKPLKMLKDGTLLMMFNKSSENDSIKITLASYNPQTRVLKKINHCGNSLRGASVADVPRFFSPMDALKLKC
ncbi:putative F-box protein At1g46984 [Rhododendron vialii]|uniref:putative F-box protein At1g46984 n=1 Tax=Rhododendron vialii TaxID=182163 RepID=UPI0026605826|nr:putative F-box protein At1g46984 [Rhododendron vialii]XP_058203411.1 putative F-box protein At1g46984 [Rhododendron vialii]